MIIKETPLKPGQFFDEISEKTQIVLHHTVSDPTSALGDIGCWNSDPSRIATCYIISLDGTINKCFPSNKWAHHLGVKAEELKLMGFKDYGTRNVELNKKSISIELDCWGGLTKKGDSYVNAYGKPISPTLQVEDCDWRGYKHFQKYSSQQLSALRELLQLLMKTYKIPNQGIRDGNLNLSKVALAGTPGIYSHSSYRIDKSDLYPDKDLIHLLDSLTV